MRVLTFNLLIYTVILISFDWIFYYIIAYIITGKERLQSLLFLQVKVELD
jgi:hypothetical protein